MADIKQRAEKLKDILDGIKKTGFMSTRIASDYESFLRDYRDECLEEAALKVMELLPRYYQPDDIPEPLIEFCQAICASRDAIRSLKSKQ